MNAWIGRRVLVLFMMLLSFSGHADWQLLQAMKVPRSEIRAAVLGDRIVVAGGIGRFAVTAACEVYDIGKDQWSACAELPMPLHHVGLVADETRVYAGGGYTTLFFKHLENPPIWVMNESLDEWRELTRIPYAIGEHELVLHQAVLFVIGGTTPEGVTAQVMGFDLKTEVWKRYADMPTPRNSMSSVVVGNEIWVIAGRDRSDRPEKSVVEIFNPKTNQWRTMPDLPIAVGGQVAANLQDRIHVLGGERLGWNGHVKSDHFRLNLNLGIQGQDVLWERQSELPEPRHGSAVAVHGGALYVIGGGSRPGLQTIYSVTGTLQRYTSQ